MPNEPTHHQQVYGFAYEIPYLWLQPVKNEQPEPTDPVADQENQAVAELVQATKEIATINPRVGQEMLRLLTEDDDASPAKTATPSRPHTQPTANAPASSTQSHRTPPAQTNPAAVTTAITPTAASVSNSPAATRGLTLDATAASAIIEVASPPANSRSSTSRNSLARKKSPSRTRKLRARITRKAAPHYAPPPRARRLTRLELHQAHCGICGHELQDEIDERFVNWEHVGSLADEYKISRSMIYRHANATGLFPKRDRNIRRALGHIIHNAAYAFTTADSVVRAVKMFAHINERGEWVNPPAHVVFSTKTRQANPAARPAAKLSGTRSHMSRRAKH